MVRLSDEYELLPRTELMRLRKEIDALKSNPLGNSPHSKTLQQSIDNLTAAVNGLVRMFSDVETQMAKEYAQQKPLQEQINVLADQNEKIAAGIVALADLVKEQHKKPPAPNSIPPPQRRPQMHPQQDDLPRPPSPNHPPMPNQTNRPPAPMGRSASAPPVDLPFDQPNAKDLPPLDFSKPFNPDFDEKPHKKGLFR